MNTTQRQTLTLRQAAHLDRREVVRNHIASALRHLSLSKVWKAGWTRPNVDAEVPVLTDGNQFRRFMAWRDQVYPRNGVVAALARATYRLLAPAHDWAVWWPYRRNHLTVAAGVAGCANPDTGDSRCWDA